MMLIGDEPQSYPSYRDIAKLAFAGGRRCMRPYIALVTGA
jgi:hypothetical protein